MGKKEKKTKLLAKYALVKDLPGLEKGVIFEHREFDPNYPDRGNRGCGVMILGWLNDNCQSGWCGETFIFPGQLADNREWFEPVVELEFPTIMRVVGKMVSKDLIHVMPMSPPSGLLSIYQNVMKEIDDDEKLEAPERGYNQTSWETH